jgi:hypothetical protein
MATPSARVVQDQVFAGARGAQDAITLGLGDRIYAGVRAIGDSAHGADLVHSYQSRMATERARDQYDAAHFGAARTVGQVVGTGAQIAALGPLEGLVAGGARIVQATPMIAREVAMLGGAGGAAGIGGQALSDLARGRPGSIGDYVGAGIGGATGALAARGGQAGRAGAFGGAATSVVQGLANGRAPSIDKARDGALAGGAFGVAGGMAGRWGSDNLTNKVKERIGEDFSRLRTWARGDQTAAGPKRREYLAGGGWTVPDQRTNRGLVESDIVESKFGRAAQLSKRQRQAYAALPNYRVDHTLPRDVGVVFGLPAAEFGYRQSPPDRD